MNIRFLNRPYPLVSRFRHQILVSALFGLFIFVFLRFFQPFGLGEMTPNKTMYVLGFGLITSLVMLANYMLTPRLAPGFFDEDRWTVGKEILLGAWIIMLISISNYQYHLWVARESMNLSAILSFIIVTTSVGIFPLTIMVLVNEIYLNRRHQNNASTLNQQIKSGEVSKHFTATALNLTIGTLPNDSISLLVDDLIFIQTQDNYCRVHFLDEGAVDTRLIRTTLKEVETQLSAFTNLVRCHRSYMVNKQKISRVTGNARAYSIHFECCEEILPVSRGIKKDSFFI